METWKAILIGALGTWLVAIFAIWGEWLRSRLFKPELRVSKGEFSGNVATHLNGKRARYYLVSVQNGLAPVSWRGEVLGSAYLV